jgi:hypothetical protein
MTESQKKGKITQKKNKWKMYAHWAFKEAARLGVPENERIAYIEKMRKA